MTDPVDSTDFFFRKHSEPKYPLAPPPESEVYKKHENRGIAVIFNHKEYYDKNIPPRDGTDKDRDDLYTTLKDLKFDVNAYDDLRSAEIAETLSRVKDLDHSEHDCLLVIVMSHGQLDKFYTRDETFPVKDLWEPFFKVPSLVGKPKIFFIQACRGNKVDKGIIVSYDEMDANNKGPKLYAIPVSADVLVMYSTFEGYYSYRHPHNGSYFIQSLVHQLKTAEDRNLLSILTNVNREVAIKYEEKEMCTVVSTLTRRFYLD